ncbi:hypothetical protein M422DRAFT_56259 [Sphaerobolus stellatus SS14]|uniref:Uncharacterized protein n=1 Tax=Sphaerobolus stellatus (strain SS14) TaxID=990650 RepID=A0A0C9TSE8_SPHS4|nr:hypothetical protein M422DRAFT_56259 [Sphaerobolus stellatus SS14]
MGISDVGLPLFTPVPETPSPLRPPPAPPLLLSSPRVLFGPVNEQLLHWADGTESCLPMTEFGEITSDPAGSEAEEGLSEEDWVFARAAKKLVQKHKECQAYRASAQHCMTQLLYEVEEIEDKVLGQLMEVACSYKKDCPDPGFGQYDGPQGALIRLVEELWDMCWDKRFHRVRAAGAI